MTIAYWCVLIVIILPYPLAVLAKVSKGGYDNSQPRAFLAGLEGKAARANWAHQNGLEAIPSFAAAVIIAHLCEADQYWVNLLALNFVACRIIYSYLYLADKPSFRSLFFGLAFFCVIGLFVISA